MYYDDEPEYTAADAAYDEAVDKREDAITEALSPMVDLAMKTVETLDDHISEHGEMPRPWTGERHWLAILQDEGEDAIREHLAEHFREEAAEEAEETANENAYNGPCCNDFSCPCGNSNNFSGV